MGHGGEGVLQQNAGLLGEHLAQGARQHTAKGLIALTALRMAVQQPGDVLQRQHGFADGDQKQPGDVLPVVLLFDGVAQKVLFHIVGDHGPGEGSAAHGLQVFVHIFGHLLQIEPHVGDLVIFRQRKVHKQHLRFKKQCNTKCKFLQQVFGKLLTGTHKTLIISAR